MVEPLVLNCGVFKEAGGIKMTLHKGQDSSGRVTKNANNVDLFYYGNIEVKDVNASKRAGGCYFEVHTSWHTALSPH